MPHSCLRALSCLASAALLSTSASADPAGRIAPDTPAHFAAKTDSFDYVRREAMIPMRDGVKLHTVILIPKGAARAPIMLDRTPYDANDDLSKAQSAHMAMVVPTTFDVMVEHGYIIAVQDVRGKYGSQGRIRERATSARPAQSHPRGSRHRRLGYGGLAGEEHA